MKFNRLNSIFILLVTAIVLLGIIQLNSFVNQYKLHEENFNSQVISVLKKLNDKIDYKNRCFETYSKTFIPPGETYFMAKQFYGNDSLSKNYDTVPMYYFGEGIDKSVQPASFTSLTFSNPIIAEIRIRFKYELNDTTTFYKYQRKLSKTNDPVLIKNIISGADPFFKQYDTTFVDSVLKSELSEQTIASSFVYAFIRSGNDSVLFTSDKKLVPQLLTKGIRYPLNDKATFIKPFYLSVYFPDKSSALLKKVWVTLLLSTLILLGLAIGFWYFLKVINRQKKLSEMKNDFINNMTHEFNTPISNIALSIETLLSNHQLPPDKTEKILCIISNENNHLRENVQRILQAASLDKNKFYLDFKPVDLLAIIRQVANTFELALQEREGKINILCNIDKAIITGDETHLINIFYNLIDNALKYCRRKPEINITIELAMDKVFISIQDNGIGIAKEHLAYIFNKFYRVPSGDTHDVKGFGLGLNYVKHVVDMHNGIIKVTSIVNKGTAFEILFPSKNNL
jgi:two-component system, OmpR family, phosphate regulon sensor histidine kinase PhoR